MIVKLPTVKVYDLAEQVHEGPLFRVPRRLAWFVRLMRPAGR